ncbi:MAG: ATP-dependent helicase [Myxococcales bacterium]|nr:ATP-dependent helicase [Myxococcales bacterium]
MTGASSPWLVGLSDVQLQVATYASGPQLVTAGPGSGKTRTLCAWIVERLVSDQAQPEEILAVTFTRRAAQELRERLQGLLGPHAERLSVGTFHRLAVQVAPLAGSLHVVEEAERLQLIEEALSGSGCRKSVASLSSLISLRKGQHPDYGQRLSSGELDLSPEELQVLRRYEQLLLNAGAVDLDDLLLRALTALLSGATGRRFRFVAVDEYQDVSAVQRALTVALGQHATVLAIGDPDQAIYAFRGGEVRHFQGFLDDFPGAVSRCLVENHRSTPQIVRASAAVIAHNPDRRSPPPVPMRPSGAALTLWRSSSPFAEAQRVAKEIERLIGGTSLLAYDSGQSASWQQGSYGFADVAILTRTVARADALGKALGESGLPFSRPSVKPAQAVSESGQAVWEPFCEADQLEDQRLALLTLHGAKGLEFAVVFLVGLEAGQIPGPGRSDAERQEERRLFFVGMTRAKERLYLSYVDASLATQGPALGESRPSPFLAEIPGELMVAEAAPKRRPPKPQLRLF